LSEPTPEFTGVHLFVRDIAASVAFYRRIGLTIAEGGGEFASAPLGEGLSLALGTYALTRGYDPAWREPSGAGTNALQFTLESREAVDATHADLVAAGYVSHVAPFDAFWGARYAEICDPDGNIVGFHSPRDEARTGAPPAI
jgi:catechol 2,3-dioxygenase-like lactoylglutathione lyase family enzyme